MPNHPLDTRSLDLDWRPLNPAPATTGTATATRLRRHAIRGAALAALAVASTIPAWAQVQPTVKPDGQWRYALGAGGSAARGNTSSTSVNLSGEAVRATADSKFDIAARGIYSKASGNTTAENAGATAQYNLDFTPLYFSFSKLDALRDEPANIRSRVSAFGGVGRHVFKTDANTWDISVGLGYSDDRYTVPTVVSNDLRTRYGRAEGLLAEESTSKVTGNTSLRQKLTFFPNLQQQGEARAVFEGGLSVAMTSTLSLTAGITYRYDSNPGIGLVKGDTLFVTGLQVKID